MSRRRGTALADAMTASCVGAIAYVYVGYPLLLALLARSRPPERLEPAATPPVTLVVSALDEQDVIADKLRDVGALDYPSDRLQVVVVTDGSRDRTPDVAREADLPDLTVLHLPERRGKAAAMARGVAHARHDIVVFSDANNLYPPEALREVVRPFADPGTGAVTGAKRVGGGVEDVSGGERAYWRYESFLKRQESRLGCCTAVVGELLAVRKDLVPAFPPDLVNDDFYLAMQVARAGCKVAYAPAALSVEPTAGSLEDDVVRRRRMAAGRWQSLFRWRAFLPVRRPVVLWQVLSHKYARLLLPFAMAGAVLGNLASVAGRRGAPGRSAAPSGLLAAQAAFYLLALAGGDVPRSAGPLRTGALAARYLVRTNWASAEGLAAYARARGSLHLWQRASRG